MNYDVEQIIAMLTDIGSIEKRLDLWFLGKGGISSPSEDICMLFDDFHFEQWYRSCQHQLTPHLSRYIEKFIKEVDSMPEFDDPFDAFVSDEWRQLTLMAQVISAVMRKERP